MTSPVTAAPEETDPGAAVTRPQPPGDVSAMVRTAQHLVTGAGTTGAPVGGLDGHIGEEGAVGTDSRTDRETGHARMIASEGIPA